MINFSELIVSVFSTLIIIICSFGIGHFLFWGVGTLAKKSVKNTPAFWKLFMGLLFLVCLYAILLTKGLSILTPILILIPLFIFHLLDVDNVVVGRKMKSATFLSFTVLFYIGFYFIVLNSFSGETIKYISGDFNIYYRIAANLNLSGIENNNLNNLYPSIFPAPYHFGDEWLYALTSKFFSKNPSIVFLVSFSVLTSIFTLGMYHYFELKFSQLFLTKGKKLYFLIFAALVSGFAFCYPKFILNADVYTFSIANWGKVILQSCFFIALLSLSRSKSWLAFLLLTIISGLAYINTMPAFYLAATLLLSFEAIRKNISWSKWLKLNSILLGFTFGYLFLLYKLLPTIGAKDIIVTKTLHGTYQHAFSLAKYFKTALSIFVGAWFQFFTLLPFLLLLFIGLLNKKESFKSIVSNFSIDLVYLIFVLLGGLLSWCAMHPFIADSVQFFSNVLPAIYATIIFLVFYYLLLIVRNNILSIMALILIIFSVYTNNQSFYYVGYFDKKEWAQLNSFLDKSPSKSSFVNFRPLKHYQSFFSKNTNFYIPINILNYRWPSYSNYSLNVPYINTVKLNPYVAEEEKMIASAPFFMYYDAAKKKNLQDNKISQQFIQDFNIEYITVSLDTLLPKHLYPFVSDSIVLKKANYTIYKTSSLF